jgi:hypothetical protein
MSAHDDVTGAGLRKWVYLYNQFLFQVIALRELTRAGRPRGCLQDVLTATLRELVEVTDQLHACGRHPARQFAGAEAALWGHAVRYVCALPWQVPPADLPFAVVADDACRVRKAWDQFAAFAAELDADVFGAIPALDPQFLRPDRLPHLAGRCGGKAPPGHLPGEPADEPALVVAPARE